jgi:glycosyltransferase involved in cell wall biosynthesis
LWSGGYNVWSDVETLFSGLQIAMEENSSIHFLSTGGAIPGHDDRTYEELVNKIEESSMRDRFHLQGWVPADHVAGYWGQADLGILTERKMYEGELGDKNRVVQWLGYGLPVAYNRVGDLGDLLAGRDLGLVFDCGDSNGLAEKILWASENPDEIGSMAGRARDYVRSELSFERTTVELMRWADRPSHAPDHGTKNSAWFPDNGAEFLATSIRSPLLRRFASLPAVKKMLRAIAGRH